MAKKLIFVVAILVLAIGAIAVMFFLQLTESPAPKTPKYYNPTIIVSGQGTTDPSPGICTYSEGTQVTITAIPDPNWKFDHWSGDVSGTQNPIIVTIDADKAIRAHFAPPCKVYGLDFGPYTKMGQNPNLGTVISEEQIRELMASIAPYTEWIRTYGCTNGLENIGRIAHELGFKIAVGAWLDGNLATNEEQISSLVNIAQAGEADMVIVGSEVLIRNDLTENQLIEYINRVKEAMPGIPVAAADVYSELLEHQAVIAAVDVVLPNYYPYWEGVCIDSAIYQVHLMHQQVTTTAGDKPVIVSETGWPSAGRQISNAVPSPENASFYFLNFVSWAKAENVLYFYFEAFDEPWKAGYEDPQGAHWGIWDNEGNLKLGMERVFNCETVASNWGTDTIDGAGNPVIEFTHVPPYDSFEDLEGLVLHVKPSDCRVTVYTKVEGGWYIKPHYNKPLTTIQPDGSWICDITTGGIDEQATEIIAFLVPNGYNPPLISGDSTLPPELDENALAKIIATRFQYNLTLNVSGQGTTEPSSGTHRYKEGTQATIAATPASGWEFSHWSGDVSGNQNPITITMNSDKTVTAHFKVILPIQVSDIFYPGGWMGDWEDITLDDVSTDTPHSESTCIKITYSAAQSQGDGWAGIYWQYPDENWGDKPEGQDLTGATKLTFWARGKNGGEKAEFKVGGIIGEYLDSIQPPVSTGVVVLSSNWQKYIIDLTGKDLSHVIGGFCWVTNKIQNPHGCTIYLDDILYE